MTIRNCHVEALGVKVWEGCGMAAPLALVPAERKRAVSKCNPIGKMENASGKLSLHSAQAPLLYLRAGPGLSSRE